MYPPKSAHNGTRHHGNVDMMSLYSLDAWPGDTADTFLGTFCYRPDGAWECIKAAR